jgi:hypothetical protein
MPRAEIGKRKTILIAFAFALALSAVSAYGRGCSFAQPGLTSDCVAGCCITNICCDDPAKNTNPADQPVHSNTTGQISLNASPAAQPTLQLPNSHARWSDCLTHAVGPPRIKRAFLCTFLI